MEIFFYYPQWFGIQRKQSSVSQIFMQETNKNDWKVLKVGHE